MKKLTAKTITTTAVFAALSLIAFMIESLFPPLFVPGAKMGLGNIFSMLALIYCSYRGFRCTYCPHITWFNANR